ncbi:MAG TPA: hypothetical protein VG603_02105 [Chitinophagales bacterium]|nr:hypothetical protein [Chitinophagales bacterium]
MKKLLPLLLIFFGYTAMAQGPVQTTNAISAGFELAIPSGGVFSIGTGASLKAEFPFAAPMLSISVTGGVTPMFYRGNLFGNAKTPGAALFVPLKAGLKYFFARGVYAEGEAGAALEANYNHATPFAFSIGPGFVISSNDKSGVDIGFRYEDWSGVLRQTAIRVAYRFGW